MVGVPRLRTMDGLERMDALRPIGFGAFFIPLSQPPRKGLLIDNYLEVWNI